MIEPLGVCNYCIIIIAIRGGGFAILELHTNTHFVKTGVHVNPHLPQHTSPTTFHFRNDFPKHTLDKHNIKMLMICMREL